MTRESEQAPKAASKLSDDFDFVASALNAMRTWQCLRWS